MSSSACCMIIAAVTLIPGKQTSNHSVQEGQGARHVQEMPVCRVSSAAEAAMNGSGDPLPQIACMVIWVYIC